MTWCYMSHEVKKYKELLTDDKNNFIGFTLSGMTYDGDGNCQWDNGTDMNIIFNSTDKMKEILTTILNDLKDIH